MAGTCGGRKGYLESWGLFRLVLRSRRHAVLGDLGGLGVGHDELVELVGL